MRAKIMKTGVVVAVAALAMAGCGSGDSGSSGSSAPKAQTCSNSAAPDGEPIVIGNVGTYSGPIGTSNVQSVPVLKAWVEQINSCGGINGHPVKLITADDQTSPSTNLTATQNQVENSGAIAFVSNMAEATADAAQSYLEGKSIPVIGGDGNLPVWFSSPMYFPTAAGLDVANYAQMALAKEQGSQLGGIWYCTDSPTCKIFADAQTASAKVIGFKTTDLQPISLAQPSFTAPCLAAQKAKADSITPNTDAGTFQRIAKSCTSVGYNPTYIGSTNSISGSYADLPPTTTVLAATQQFPFFLTKGAPGLTEYAKVVAGIDPKQMNSSASQTWAAIQLFELAAKAGVPKGGTPTSAEILKGLYTVKDNTLGGLTVPLTFTEGKPAEVSPCWFSAKYSDGKFSSPSGLTPVCADGPLS